MRSKTALTLFDQARSAIIYPTTTTLMVNYMNLADFIFLRPSSSTTPLISSPKGAWLSILRISSRGQTSILFHQVKPIQASLTPRAL